MLSDRLQGMNIYLIGMMGAGKTTIGKRLAAEMEYRFFDTDTLVEKVTQKSINQIFAEAGEKVFRELETEVLGQLCAYNKSVVATGGGIVLKPENWGYLRHGLIIWLDTPIQVIYQRLVKNDTRPLLKQGDLLSKITQISQERQKFYQEADLQINSQAEQNPEVIAAQILELIPTVLKER